MGEGRAWAALLVWFWEVGIDREEVVRVAGIPRPSTHETGLEVREILYSGNVLRAAHLACLDFWLPLLDEKPLI